MSSQASLANAIRVLAIDAIQFNFGEAPGNRIRAAYRLAINDYNGVQTPQLMIEHFESVEREPAKR